MSIPRFSIYMAGCHACNMKCLYCSAETDSSKTLQADWGKVYKTIMSSPMYQQEFENFRKNNQEPIVHFDIWGGNPMFHWEAFKETISNLKELFPKAEFSTSDNGLSISDDEKMQYCIDNNIKFQLSHDGLGQWIRSGDFDPLYDEKTAINLVELVKHGIISSINCCLNKYNCSPMKNIQYYNKWRIENHIEFVPNFTIRINHPWPGSETIQKLNTKGRWQDTIREDLIGKPIGSLEITGDELNTFMHEMRMLGLMIRNPEYSSNIDIQPYVYYIRDQTSKYKYYENDFCRKSTCRDFQRGYINFSFAIDTLGNYCECNLVDSSQHVKNPGGYFPSYCDGCKYKHIESCARCGSENYPEKCDFHKEFARMQEEFFLIDNKTLLFTNELSK